MNFQKFTIKSQEAVQNAQEIAASYSNQSIEPEHLLAALVQDPEGLVVPILQKIGANVDYIKIKINELITKMEALDRNLKLPIEYLEVFVYWCTTSIE